MSKSSIIECNLRIFSQLAGEIHQLIYNVNIERILFARLLSICTF